MPATQLRFPPLYPNAPLAWEGLNDSTKELWGQWARSVPVEGTDFQRLIRSVQNSFAQIATNRQCFYFNNPPTNFPPSIPSFQSPALDLPGTLIDSADVVWLKTVRTVTEPFHLFGWFSPYFITGAQPDMNNLWPLSSVTIPEGTPPELVETVWAAQIENRNGELPATSGNYLALFIFAYSEGQLRYQGGAPVYIGDPP